MATGGGEALRYPISGDDFPFKPKKASTINISTYTHQPVTSTNQSRENNVLSGGPKLPSLTSIRSNSSDSVNEQLRSPGNPQNMGLMYDRHENYTNTNTTDVNDVSMKIDFSDIFRDSSYTHDSTTWTQCCCNCLFWVWECLSCKDLDIQVYKALLAGVLLMNLFNLLTEILLLLSEFRVIETDYDDEISDDGSARLGLQLLYSLGVVVVFGNCLLILKLIYRPTTRSALNSALLIVFLLLLYIVQLAMYLKYRDRAAKHNVLFLSIVALFFILQMISSILLYRYWEYAMFSFDDAVNLHDLFLDTVSGEDFSSSQKHYLDIKEASRRRGGNSSSGGSGSGSRNQSRAIIAAVNAENSINGRNQLTPVNELDQESPSSSGDGRKRVVRSTGSHQQSQGAPRSQSHRSFAASIRASFNFGSTPRVAHQAPQRPQKAKKGTPRGSRARHASMLSNENVSLHNSLLEQQHLQQHQSNNLSNLKLAKFFDNAALSTTTTVSPLPHISQSAAESRLDVKSSPERSTLEPASLPRPPPITVASSNQNNYANHNNEDRTLSPAPSAPLTNNQQPPPALSHPGELLPSNATERQHSSSHSTPSASMVGFMNNLLGGRSRSTSGGSSQLYNLYPFRTNSNNPAWSSNSRSESSQQSQQSLIEAVTMSSSSPRVLSSTLSPSTAIVSPISSTIQQNAFQPSVAVVSSSSTHSQDVANSGKERTEADEAV